MGNTLSTLICSLSTLSEVRRYVVYNRKIEDLKFGKIETVIHASNFTSGRSIDINRLFATINRLSKSTNGSSSNICSYTKLPEAVRDPLLERELLPGDDDPKVLEYPE